MAKHVRPSSKLLIVKHLGKKKKKQWWCSHYFAHGLLILHIADERRSTVVIAEKSIVKMWRKQNFWNIWNHLWTQWGVGTRDPQKNSTKEQLSSPGSFSSPEKEVPNPKKVPFKDPNPNPNKGRNELSTPKHEFFVFFGWFDKSLQRKQRGGSSIVNIQTSINQYSFWPVSTLLEYKYIKHETEVRSLEYWSKPNNNNLSSTLIHLYSNTCKPSGC